MITVEQLFHGKPHTARQESAAADLLEGVNACLDWARLGGFMNPIDPDTGTQISGVKGGTGGGGFRMEHEGPSERSSHKILWNREHGAWVHDETMAAVDVYDPGDVLDRILSDADLERFGLYREAPEATPGWCHLTTRPPASGKRTFLP